MEFLVRELTEADRPIWAEMRMGLWPEHSREWHVEEVDEILRDPDVSGFIAETAASEPVGFAEIAIRKYVNGCDSSPVPFLEGIWVNPLFRHQGAGGQLSAHIEGLMKARGFTEIGSDALIDNHISHEAHARWGFSETERVVYFRKVL
jgi:aminoglycoside 6'-N-acetyltransferase I